MADISFQPAGRRPFSRLFSGIGLGLSMSAAARSRMTQIERLNAMSDDDLAARGLSRDAIPRYVFRDLIGL